MRLGWQSVAVVAMAVLALCQGVRAEAETKPATRPASPEFVISEMREQTMAGVTFLYDSDETTFAELGQTIGSIMPSLSQAAEAGRIPVAGPAIFIYRDIKEDTTKPFTLEIGFVVKEGTKAIDTYQVRKTKEFKCATVIFSGALKHLPKAYAKIMAEIKKAGLKPSGECREVYLAWEGPTSANNVVQIQMGLKD